MKNPEDGLALSEVDKADLASLGVDVSDEADGAPVEDEPKHTLLQVWKEVLSNIETSAKEKVGPALAARITNAWKQMTIQEVPVYHAIYHQRLLEMRAVLLAEIETDSEALNNTENDAEDNRVHYLNLLLAWQQQVLLWEHEWDASADDAHIQFAAIGDASNFVLGERGLVAHLEHINFQLTEADSEALAVALMEWKEAQ